MGIKLELLEGLQQLGFIQNVGEIPTLPNTINGRFDKIRAAELMRKTDGLAYSLGSACNSADAKLSHVLKAMGLTDAQIQSSFRISLGRFNSSEEIKDKLRKLIENKLAKLIYPNMTDVDAFQKLYLEKEFKEYGKWILSNFYFYDRILY